MRNCKYIFLIWVCIFLPIISLGVKKEPKNRLPNPGITLEMKAKSLKDFCEYISKSYKLRLQAHEDIQARKLVIIVDNKPLDVVLEKIAKVLNFDVEEEEDGYFFYQKSKTKEKERRLIQEFVKQQVEFFRQIVKFYLDYLEMPEEELFIILQNNDRARDCISTLKKNEDVAYELLQFLYLLPFKEQEKLIYQGSLNYTLEELPNGLKEGLINYAHRLMGSENKPISLRKASISFLYFSVDGSCNFQFQSDVVGGGIFPSVYGALPFKISKGTTCV